MPTRLKLKSAKPVQPCVCGRGLPPGVIIISSDKERSRGIKIKWMIKNKKIMGVMR